MGRSFFAQINNEQKNQRRILIFPADKNLSHKRTYKVYSAVHGKRRHCGAE